MPESTLQTLLPPSNWHVHIVTPHAIVSTIDPTTLHEYSIVTHEGLQLATEWDERPVNILIQQLNQIGCQKVDHRITYFENHIQVITQIKQCQKDEDNTQVRGSCL